jgi:hypothetical protein
MQPVPDTIGISSSTYMFYKYRAASLTYEVGHNSTRAFVKKKADVAALKLTEIMLK